MPPLLARKILIVAALDGLILSPLYPSRPTKPSSPAGTPPGSIHLSYASKLPTPYSGTSTENDPYSRGAAIEAHGIAGLLTVSPSTAFLIAITGRNQVALIRDRHPIYCVSDITLIPLSSRRDAQAAIDRQRSKDTTRALDGESEESAEEEDDVLSPVEDAQEQRGGASGGIGEEVIAKKGAFGRFAKQWFSKRGWSEDMKRAEGMSASSSGEGPDAAAPRIRPGGSGSRKVEDQPADSEGERDEVWNEKTQQGEVEDALTGVKKDLAHGMTPKLLHTVSLLLARSRGFYFAYDWDITRAYTNVETKKLSMLPLSKLVDPLFFWNRHLQKAFLDAGLHQFVLPLMQGFVGQRGFTGNSGGDVHPDPEAAIEQTAKSVGNDKTEDLISFDSDDDADKSVAAKDFATGDTREPEKPPLPPRPPRQETQDMVLTLISRRSTKRPGLRYLRRGVDEQGHCANSVETEQLLSTGSWDRVFSYLQVRGSIPVYFQQSPYSLRPKPVLLLTPDANISAMSSHFTQMRDRYGTVHVVSLVERQGSEAIVGSKYEEYLQRVNASRPTNAPEIGWSWFDFHRVCRGMRFENVAELFEEIGDVLDGFSYTEEKDGAFVGNRQKGVLRTNCMDCLDRTNVVQSAAARRTLEAQLAACDIEIRGQSTEFFNLLWADNGDAVSKQYASSAALKGDFTRTRKRNFAGALTDFSLTMTRYFQNMIGDFFTQAAIDFLLGNVTAQVFADFEAEMVSGDPAVSMRRLRQNAIEISSKIVVADEREVLLGGWTFLAPREEGEVRMRAGSATEKVLLLTEAAVYACGFDFELEKVIAFERVPLADVMGLQWGTYITSTLARTHTEPSRNVGFLLRFRASTADEIRYNTRSLRTLPSSASELAPPLPPRSNTGATTPNGTATKFWAFKILPGDGAGLDERDVCQVVCSEIASAVRKATGREMEEGVREGEVIGIEEARRRTGLVEQVGYSLKKLVWA